MTDIAVLARIPCQAGMRATVAAGLRPMLDHVETETGTITYLLFEDDADADVLWMYEMYESQEALDAHRSTDAMTALGAAIGPHLAGRPELTFLTPLGGKGLE